MSGEGELRVSLHAITAPPPLWAMHSPGPWFGARQTGIPLAYHTEPPNGESRCANTSRLGVSPRTSSYHVRSRPPELSGASATWTWFEGMEDTRSPLGENRRLPLPCTRCARGGFACVVAFVALVTR